MRSRECRILKIDDDVWQIVTPNRSILGEIRRLEKGYTARTPGGRSFEAPTRESAIRALCDAHPLPSSALPQAS